jgi:predicted RNA-binding Zn-ribbon protein involved in translation (DUF1610 family)
MPGPWPKYLIQRTPEQERHLQQLSSSYTCPLCGYHQSLPRSYTAYRCPSCGLRMCRDRSTQIYHVQRVPRRGVGLELTLFP